MARSLASRPVGANKIFRRDLSLLPETARPGPGNGVALAVVSLHPPGTTS